MIYFLVASTLIRVIGIGSSSIWGDEAISLYRAQHHIYTNIWDELLIPFSNGSLLLLRLPALLFSILSMYLAWKIMDRLNFNNRQRWISCIGLAALPGLIWTAHDARCYAALSACYLGALLFAMENKPLGLAACVGLLSFIHPTGAGFGLSALLISLLYMPWKRSALAAIGAVVWIPAILPVMFASVNGADFWLEKVDLLSSIGLAVGVNTIHPLIIGFFTVLLVGVSFWRRQAWPLSLAVFLPVGIMLLIGLVYSPVLFYRPMIPLVIPICLMAGIGLCPRRSTWLAWLPAAIACFILVLCVRNYDTSNMGGHLDAMAEMVNANWEAGDRIIYAYPSQALPLDYYMDHPGCIDGLINPIIIPDYLDYEICNDDDYSRTWYITGTIIEDGVMVGFSHGSWQISPTYLYLIDKLPPDP